MTQLSTDAKRVLSWFVTAGVVSRDGMPHGDREDDRTRWMGELMRAWVVQEEKLGKEISIISAIKEAERRGFVTTLRKIVPRGQRPEHARLRLTDAGMVEAVRCYNELVCGRVR